MNIKPIKQKQVERLVEEALTEKIIVKSYLDSCIKMWRDFAALTDVTRTRKPNTWAAAILYSMECITGEMTSQEEAAHVFDVSSVSVSIKYRQIDDTLGLTWLDNRYLNERQISSLGAEFDMLEGMSISDMTPPGRLASLQSLGVDPIRRAQELVYEGWEAVEHDHVEALLLFSEALDLNPNQGDALNGIATIAEDLGDLERAETLYRMAWEAERETLGSETPDAYHWWLELKTRPYMRARFGLGWVLHNMERYAEALKEFEALLWLNPGDNQGVRHLIAPLHQLNNDVASALKAYEEYDQSYPDDMQDPHFNWCRGLALYAAGRHAEAVAFLRRTLLENVYLAPLLVDAPQPSSDGWHRSNLNDPTYADEFLEIYGALWEDAADAHSVVRRLWNDPEVVADVGAWLGLGKKMMGMKEAVRSGDSEAREQWTALYDARTEIEKRALSPDAMRRILDDADAKG